MSFLSQFGSMHEQAIEFTGLSDFGSDEYREPMQLLLTDLDRNQRISDIGAQVIIGSIVGDLMARLHSAQGFKTHPDLLKTPIEKPVIICGMMRTGTTVLHRLIGEDPSMQILPLWLATTPMPRPPRETWSAHPAFQQAQRSLELLYQVMPHFKQVHPQRAEAADEDRYLMNHSFYNYSMGALADIPEYVKWLDSVDVGYAYRYYRKALALIGGGDTRTWLLKCPTHLWHLPDLLKVFPDACIVMTHRDPVKSVTSIISMLYGMRKLVEPDTTHDAYGKESLARWGRLLNASEQDRVRLDQRRFFDIHSDDIRADPIASIERIYRYFDIPITDEARSRWRKSVAANPTGGHAEHHYAPEDFGISAREIRDSVGMHYQRYLDVCARIEARNS